MSLSLPIALDAMGGDHAPTAMVDGAVRAARQGIPVTLVGREDEVKQELERFGGSGWTSLPITIVHASDVIGMDDHATDVRKNKNLSINVAVRLLREKRVSAVVAQGHTGATLVSSLFGLGRIPGVERPAIVANFPNAKGRVTLADVGANADNRAEFLQGFALMGAAYVQAMTGNQNPSVGLLTIGEEEGKGNALVLEAYEMLKATPGLNFYGNVEGRDIFKGTTDVVVTDGFTGNIVLKAAEQEARLLFGWIRDALTGGGLLTKLGATLIKPALRGVATRLDPAEYGAQPLLGVRGLVFIGHGSSDAKAVESALKIAAKSVEANLLERVTEKLSVLARKLEAAEAST
jgi:glycerol-3-phosphate acyltransferase PlsX